jgi:SpoVK/Ycf46/Vps4 family AAA+-type ATPase
VFGTFLSWMQEKTSAVFVIATANNISLLPPEMMRKGRFDEIFFVDLPDAATRGQVLTLHLRKRRLPPESFDIPALALAADGFSGAEIEQAIVAMLYAARAEQRPADTALLLAELRNTRPLSVLMAEQVTALRAWARQRTVPAD